MCNSTNQAVLAYFGDRLYQLAADNLKSGVSKWHTEVPALNPTFADFARHCGMAVMPAIPGRTRDMDPVG
ncbi:MAG: hypothetical protein OXN84_08455, partial [Albidovulum sp.]|nr:hypothetical protein [Albidovulum sp.]